MEMFGGEDSVVSIADERMEEAALDCSNARASKAREFLRFDNKA